MWPKCAFGDQKGLIRSKDMPFGIPPYHGTKNCRVLKISIFYLFLPFVGQKVVFWVKKWCFWVFWTGCEVSDLKERHKTTSMDHGNKIQSLVLPTDGPGDTPDCITEYGPYTCEYGRMCSTAPTAEKNGVSPEPTLHLAFLVRPEPSKSMPATKHGQQRLRWGFRPSRRGQIPAPTRSLPFLEKFGPMCTKFKYNGQTDKTMPLVSGGDRHLW